MKVYADSSFIVSLYLTDQHSLEARVRVCEASSLWLTPLHRAEWAHAVAQNIFRKALKLDEAPQMQGQLEHDKAAGLWTEIAMPETAYDLCADLGRRYGSKIPIRTLDSLHVACALELKAERFWTFDERQAKLAKAVGLKGN